MNKKDFDFWFPHIMDIWDEYHRGEPVPRVERHGDQYLIKVDRWGDCEETLSSYEDCREFAFQYE